MMSREKMNTRERILNSAWALLEADAVREVRMSDIAADAGISRQALYLHFPNRAELLVATTRYIDEVKDVDGRLAASRSAASGRERLTAFIDMWCNYIPEVYGVLKAIMAMKDTDAEAAIAWNDRMQAVRHGCEAAVKALAKDGDLTPKLSTRKATDTLWMLLSVRNWEQLTIECGWSQKQYISTIRDLVHQALIAEGNTKAGK